MRHIHAWSLCLLALTLLISGCASQKKYTQAQMNAIEVRIVDANFDETFNAATNALFDAGYIIGMSDKDAGLLTGSQVRTLGFWESFAAESPYQSMVMTLQVIEESDTRCRVRVKLALNGVTTVNEKVVDQIWVLMQRQVLMSAPPTIEPAEDATPAS